MTTPRRVSRAEIDAARKPASGWDRATLKAWGVTLPLTKGWRSALERGLPQPRPREPRRISVSLAIDASMILGMVRLGYLAEQDRGDHAAIKAAVERVLVAGTAVAENLNLTEEIQK